MPLSVDDWYRVVKLSEDQAAEIKQWITQEIGTAMSQLTDSTVGLINDFTHQLQQISDQLGNVISGLQASEADAEARAAAAEQALQSLQGEVDTNVSTMEAKRDELQADDEPAPTEPPAEEPPA